ncbi:MAG: DUF4328 domain-containing protein [Gemmataceae bacterium]|nr:DUF4328 domain-containing protein [Gemmataceae bacterium]
MNDTIPCPNCGRLLQASEGYQGREVRSPECQTVFVVGRASDITETAPKPPTPPGASAVQSGLPPAEAASSARTRRRAPDDYDYETPDRVVLESEFRPANSLALSVKVLLALLMFFNLAILGSNYLQLRLAERAIAGQEVQLAEVDSNDLRQLALGVGYLVLSIATVVVFLIWFYRAHANLTPLGARGLSYTSGWAVGFWFVPFLNLVRPVQIAQEIWRNSDPSAVRPDGVHQGTASSSALIGFWWAIYLIANVINNISFRMSLDARTPEALRGGSDYPLENEGWGRDR